MSQEERSYHYGNQAMQWHSPLQRVGIRILLLERRGAPDDALYPRGNPRNTLGGVVTEFREEEVRPSGRTIHRETESKYGA